MTKNTDYLDVVDENDKVIDKKTFEECHAKGLRHRSVHLEIYSDENKSKILIVRRSKDKIHNQETLEIPGGHVWTGESYAEAAARDIKGELGLTIPLTQIAKEENNSSDSATGIIN